jgi:glycosyltransferase involved in cell wall biosynthesis
MSSTFDVSIVVPTYNERERLEDLVGAVHQATAARGLAVEVVVVDDNSPDGTGQIADALAARGLARVVHRAGKLGLGSAVVEASRWPRHRCSASWTPTCLTRPACCLPCSRHCGRPARTW